MTKEKIIITGCSGLVGSRCVEILSSKFDLLGIGTKFNPTFQGDKHLALYNQCDITDPTQVSRIIGNSDASTVIHLAALIDLDKGEQTRNKGNESLWWKINVEGTRNIARACQQEGKRLIYASTDYLFGFDGGPFNEDDKVAQNPNNISWYAWTKLQGEESVAKILSNWVSVRFSIPFRSFFPDKLDFARMVVERFKKGEELTLYDDQVISPVFIDDLADFLGFLISTGRDINGIIHFAGSFNPSNPPSPFSFGKAIIEKVFGQGDNIKPSSYEEFLETAAARKKAPRPIRAGLISNRLSNIGYPQPLLLDEINRFTDQYFLN